MIHSAIPTVSPVLTVFSLEICFVLLDFDKWGLTYVRTDRRLDNMCENNDHYRPRLWVGRVDQEVGVTHTK